jgi:hypothetical protein
VSGEEPSLPEDEDQNNNDLGDAQQDFSEPLDPADAVVGEPEPEPEPQLPAPPAETPSTSNNGLIMQIKILSGVRKGYKTRHVRRFEGCRSSSRVRQKGR